MSVIALDLGGTKLAAALLDPGGNILARSSVALGGCEGAAVGELVCRGLEEMIARSPRGRVQAVGISVPGISYQGTGRVWAPNIPGWENYPLGAEIRRVLKKKVGGSSPARPRVVISNDRACYILGEAWRGAAVGCRHAIFLAVGTGIGAGILVDGRVLDGAGGTAGSIGWLALDRPFRPEYVLCGCFEHHASGAGLGKVAREYAGGEEKQMDARELFAAARRGEALAKRVLDEAVEFWGMAVANLVSLFDPEVIIFGGGVFGPGKRLLPRIHREARKWAQPIAMKRVRVRSSKLGPDAGLYGAAFLALEQQTICRRDRRRAWENGTQEQESPRGGMGNTRK